MCCQSWVVVVVVVNGAVVGVIFRLDEENYIRDRVSKAKIETRPSIHSGKKEMVGSAVSNIRSL